MWVKRNDKMYVWKQNDSKFMGNSIRLNVICEELLSLAESLSLNCFILLSQKGLDEEWNLQTAFAAVNVIFNLMEL